MTKNNNRNTPIRIKEYWENEVKSKMETIRQFEILAPSGTQNGSSHNGEDGRHIEGLISNLLRKGLPKDLEVMTGFIYKPKVRTGGRSNKRDMDEFTEEVSSQLDIVVYDSSKYPMFNRSDNTAIFIPEGVVGIISVKKTLVTDDIAKEISNLHKAAKICSLGETSDKYRGPFTAVLGVKSPNAIKTDLNNWFEKMVSVYCDENLYFDELVNFIGLLDGGCIYKRSPEEGVIRGQKRNGDCRYKYFVEEDHALPIQLIITGILSCYYSRKSGLIQKPGYVSFDTENEKFVDYDKTIEYIALRRDNQ